MAKVKQVVKMVMSGQGGRNRRQLERSFRRLDKDQSGSLSFDELNFALRKDFAVKGLTPGDLVRLFNHLDADGSGAISSS